MHEKISFREKTALGVGSFAGFLGGTLVKSLAVPVYQMTLGVNPALLGIALALPRLWDAFTDPVMGNISDNFQSRFGRRKPFIVAGAVLTGVSFGIVWMVPQHWSDIAKLVYFIIASLIYYTCYTIYAVPSQSLILEMTPDYDERTKVTAFCGFFGKAGEFVYQWIFPLTQLAIFATAMQGIRTVGWLTGIFLIAGIGVIPGIFVKERYYHQAQKQPKVRFLESAKAVLRNRGFAILISLVILTTFAGMFASCLDYYLLVYYVCDGSIVQGSVWKAVLSSEYAIVGILSIWPVLWLSKRFSKQAALQLIYALTVIGGIVKWFVYTPGHPWLISVDPVLCGPIWTAISMLQPSMMADVCDDDERHHGQRREGMFGALYSWIWKCGISLSFLLSGVALVLAGFDEQLGGAQTSQTFTVMRLIFAGIPALTSGLTIILLSFYPITRRQAQETRRILEDRRGQVE
ncbi:MAG: MFS transporter [Kiritimatiellales bacterium]